MGNYVFSTRTLLRELYADASRENSTHDFGRDILPALVQRVEMYAYNFQDNQIPGEAAGAAAYWRDVGTLDAYYAMPIRPPSSPSTTRIAAATPSTPSSRAAASSRAAWSGTRSSGAGCAYTAARTSRTA